MCNYRKRGGAQFARHGPAVVDPAWGVVLEAEVTDPMCSLGAERKSHP